MVNIKKKVFRLNSKKEKTYKKEQVLGGEYYSSKNNDYKVIGALGLILDDMQDYFKKPEVQDKKVFFQYNLSAFDFGYTVKNLPSIEKTIPVLITSAQFSSTNTSRSVRNPHELDLEFCILVARNVDFKEVEESRLVKLIAKNPHALLQKEHQKREKDYERQSILALQKELLIKYKSFEHFLFDTEKGFNNFPLDNMKIVLPLGYNLIHACINKIDNDWEKKQLMHRFVNPK